MARNFKRLPETGLCLCRVSNVLPEQQFAFEPMRFGFVVVLIIVLYPPKRLLEGDRPSLNCPAAQ